MDSHHQPSMRSVRYASERGAVLIQVAVASLVLIAFTAFVVDYGILWVSRNAAQNSADAGALAGAIALGLDDFDNRDDDGPAKLAALNFALANDIFGEDPDVNVETDIYFYPDDPAKFPAECVDDSCIRVDVYRNQDRGNPLPIWFGLLVGLTEQGVRATAIGRASLANATDCLKPWAVVDRWQERHPVNPGVWTVDSTFDKYIDSGPSSGTPDPAIDPPDLYIAPTEDDPGTGFHPFNADHSYTSDYGLPLVLKAGNNNDFQFGSGWFKALSFGGPGGAVYEDNIKGCVGITYKIGDELEVDNEPGAKVGPTRQGVMTDSDSLYNQDPTAFWDPTMNGGRGGVNGSAFAVSPRIVAVPLVNPDIIAEVNKGGRTTVPISNIMGFFIEGMTPDNKGVMGRLMTMPGLMSVGEVEIGPESAFLINISLIR
jgi:Flp pilus assembly protein TadG